MSCNTYVCGWIFKPAEYITMLDYTEEICFKHFEANASGFFKNIEDVFPLLVVSIGSWISDCISATFGVSVSIFFLSELFIFCQE